jgi:hypothetical protein
VSTSGEVDSSEDLFAELSAEVFEECDDHSCPSTAPTAPLSCSDAGSQDAPEATCPDPLEAPEATHLGPVETIEITDPNYMEAHEAPGYGTSSCGSDQADRTTTSTAAAECPDLGSDSSVPAEEIGGLGSTELPDVVNVFND